MQSATSKYISSIFVRRNRQRFTLLSAVAAFLMLTVTPLPAHADGEIRNFNFAVFQKYDENFEFEPIVLGKFSDFIQAMKGSMVLMISQTRNAVNGDVINVQQDVLRDAEGSLNDMGINCSLSYLDLSSEDNTSFEVGGLCKIIDSLNTNVTVIIPMIALPDTEQGIDAWVALYEDEENGIAFYANVSSSQ
ncbi:hypothetical protein MMIC_P0866 [Mariprofundus micogutta]|uniref:Uncharacterized protein n=1 Tax=Mariprofundus micogutta TaxID=1921010 RepID=A0A1L8CLW4_9PROT|nr:hypothetical protein [Mariprofundus micogutta]GAV19908.1 hypothetical protein MMIC_P0866 [Mariprofundus micogutta]